MDVVGLCRFSYPAIGGFQREQETLQDRISYLYDRNRLEQRFRLFETFCLPSIVAQTDRDFKFIILIGQDLPDWAHDRLERITANIPMTRIAARPPIRHRTVAGNTINDFRDFGSPLSGQFRLDDDDAVHQDFVKQMKSYGEKLDPVFENTHHFALDFANGFAVHIHGAQACVQQVKKPCWTPALAGFFRWSTDLTIMNFNHVGLFKHMNTVMIPTPPMFIRSFHGENDSNPMRPDRDAEFIPIAQALADPKFQNFGIDPNKVKQIWASLRDGHSV